MLLRNRGRWLSVLTLSCLTGLSIGPLSAAYPISPMTLWELTGEADLVVVARVERIAPPTKLDDLIADGLARLGGNDSWELPTLAVLEVEERWKGRAGKRVVVAFRPNLACPAPARYVTGETVIAFLERRPGKPFRWRTVALSYGTLYPEPEDLEVFRSLVRRAVQLQGEPTVGEEDRRDWLVTAAADRATRWHGLYPLVPSADEFHSFYDRTPRLDQKLRLTAEGLRRVAEGFVAEPSVDVTLPMTLALLRDHRDPRVDEAAIAAIEARLDDEWVPHWLLDAMALVFLRFGDDDPAGRFAAVEQELFRVDPVTLREAWEDAREALGLPYVRPAEVPEPRVLGIGATTPP